MLSQIYEDVVLRAVFDPSTMANHPGIHCNGLRGRSADPTQEAGWGVRTLMLITSASFSHLFLLKALGLGSESMGPSMIITILLLTSYDKQHHLFPRFPDSPVFQAFILAVPLNQALRQPH